MDKSAISEIIKALNNLLREKITLESLNDEFEVILKKVEAAGLKIKAMEATKLFASFEFENGIIIAYLYNNINHRLIKNLIEKYNFKKH